MRKKFGVIALMLSGIPGAAFAQDGYHGRRYYDRNYDQRYYQQDNRDWNRHLVANGKNAGVRSAVSGNGESANGNGATTNAGADSTGAGGNTPIRVNVLNFGE